MRSMTSAVSGRKGASLLPLMPFRVAQVLRRGRRVREAVGLCGGFVYVVALCRRRAASLSTRQA